MNDKIEKIFEIIDEVADKLSKNEYEEYWDVVEANSVVASRVEYMSHDDCVEQDVEQAKAEIEFLLESSEVSVEDKKKLRALEL